MGDANLYPTLVPQLVTAAPVVPAAPGTGPLPQLPSPEEVSKYDPLRAYKFEVEVVDPAPSENITKIPFMSVTGLRASRNPGDLVLTRAVVKINEPYLYDWWNETSKTQDKPKAARDMYVIVDDGVEFLVKSAIPTHFGFNDLDAGGGKDHVFLETIRVQYLWISPKYL